MFANIGGDLVQRRCCKRLGERRCSRVKAPGACPKVCAGDDVRCVAGEPGAGAVAGGVAVAADEPLDVGSSCAVAASACDSVVVSGVLTAGEEGF